MGSGLPQLIIYLAAVQDGRKEAGRLNSSVFGVLSDSITFVFARLSSSRKLFVSRPYFWRSEQVKVVQWIDRILLDAIHASPHTSPVKKGNQSLMAYDHHLQRGFQFGVPQDKQVELIEDVEYSVTKLIIP